MRSFIFCILTCFLLCISCSKNEPINKIDVNSRKTIINNQIITSFSDLNITTTSLNFSNDVVLVFDTWDDVDDLLSLWQNENYSQINNQYTELGYTNTIVESNILYDYLYYYTLEELALTEEELDYGTNTAINYFSYGSELIDNDFDLLFEENLEDYIGILISVDTVIIDNAEELVLNPIGPMDIYALFNEDGYLIVDDVLYKDVEGVVIYSEDADDCSTIANICSLEDLEDVLESDETSIVINTYKRKAPPGWTEEEYYLFIMGFINQHKAWYVQRDYWLTPTGTNSIGQYYSAISFEGSLFTPRSSNQNSCYKSSLRIVNYRKRNGQSYWHRCKLPTTINATIYTSVSYYLYTGDHGGIESTPFPNQYIRSKKFYSLTLNWKSPNMGIRINLGDMTNHVISGETINFNNGRTSLSISAN